MLPTGEPVRVGTRRSQLAMAQTRSVIALLQAREPQVRFEIGASAPVAASAAARDMPLPPSRRLALTARGGQ